MKPVKIEITKKDIACGKRRDGKTCPISLAVRRKLKLAYGQVHVTTYSARFDSAEIETRNVLLPKKAEKFISKFDNNEPVKPFSFVLGRKIV